MVKFYKSGIMVVVCAMLASGCAAVLVGAGGTALWQHGKIVSEEPKPVSEVQAATKEAMKVKKITINDEVARDNFVQLRGDDQDGEKIAVDIILTSSTASRIEIRVGVGVGKKQPARDLLLEIKKQLYEQKGFKLF